MNAVLSLDDQSALERAEILSRYRRYRQIGLDHHSAAMKFTSMQYVLDRAKRVGLGDGRGVFEMDDTEHALLMDLTLYTSHYGRSRAIDRYAKAAAFAPGSDEALVLAAMRRARFSVWEIKRRHPVAGLVLYDLERTTETWLLDVNLTESAPVGGMMGGRMFDMDGFSMGCGVFVPVSDDLLEDTWFAVPGPVDADPEVAVEDPRFATELYRGAVASGALATIQFRSVA